ncbi:zinc-binding dehydrogenase [Tautonia sociabilis]|uniref:alcohol dehydrogenase n=1 Tax=Tautonia sociabilis TaxID=2080755 RepID=A0A432MP49_9BACT|nr:zinc-binding dehydrogenase [Tautonia sociabilis]RUL89182.1 alcohol dehydrogenase [Tautonia sociabilis]
MATTRAAIFLGAGRPIEVREIPLPRPRGEEILVDVVACTLCGSDLHSIRGHRSVPVPTVLGHEILGRILEFGPEAPRIDASGQPMTAGDRITWAVVARCGDCFYCRRGLPQKCEHQTKYGHEPMKPGQELTGGLAGHCLLAPGTAAFVVPEGLPDAVACPSNCATATVAAAIEAAGPLSGARVLVLGSGMLGLTAAAWARSLGAEAVLCCDKDADRLARSSAFGATHQAGPEAIADLANECSEGRGLDVVIELTGAPEAVELGLPRLRMGGTLVLVGSVSPTRPVAMLPEQVVRRCLTIRGVHNYRPDHLGAALRFLESSAAAFPFGKLVGQWRPLSSLDGESDPAPAGGAPRLGIRPD